MKSFRAHFLIILFWTLHRTDLQDFFSTMCPDIWDVWKPFTTKCTHVGNNTWTLIKFWFLWAVCFLSHLTFTVSQWSRMMINIRISGECLEMDLVLRCEQTIRRRSFSDGDDVSKRTPVTVRWGKRAWFEVSEYHILEFDWCLLYKNSLTQCNSAVAACCSKSTWINLYEHFILGVLHYVWKLLVL